MKTFEKKIVLKVLVQKPSGKNRFEALKSKILQKKIVLIIWSPKSFGKNSIWRLRPSPRSNANTKIWFYRTSFDSIWWYWITFRMNSLVVQQQIKFDFFQYYFLIQMEVVSEVLNEAKISWNWVLYHY